MQSGAVVWADVADGVCVRATRCRGGQWISSAGRSPEVTERTAACECAEDSSLGQPERAVLMLLPKGSALGLRPSCLHSGTPPARVVRPAQPPRVIRSVATVHRASCGMARDVERASRWIAVKPLMPAVGTAQPATRLVRTPLHLAAVRLLSSSAPPNAGHPPLSLVQGVPARPPQLRIVPKGRSQCSHHPARGPTPPTQRIANGGLTEPRRLPQTTDRGPSRSFPQLTDARGEVGHQRRPQILHVHTLKQPGGGVAVTGPRRPSWRTALTWTLRKATAALTANGHNDRHHGANPHGRG